MPIQFNSVQFTFKKKSPLCIWYSGSVADPSRYSQASIPLHSPINASYLIHNLIVDHWDRAPITWQSRHKGGWHSTFHGKILKYCLRVRWLPDGFPNSHTNCWRVAWVTKVTYQVRPGEHNDNKQDKVNTIKDDVYITQASLPYSWNHKKHYLQEAKGIAEK